MREDDDVFIMGEDIAEMGGSMGVTQGMLEEFGPERVRNTPISEMAIVGAGIGAAMQGMRPVVEIMYEDFTTLAMEQIVNQAAKHRYMSGGQLKVPLTVRTQGGAGWSPGAQHAQQLEAWFVHVPGLKVVFASTPADVRGLLWSSIYDDNPVLFFEHRTLYPIKEEVPEELEPIPLGQARVHREGEDVTVVATGRLVHEALAAAEEAEKEGISVEVVDPRTLQPLDEDTIVASVKKTNRCVVAHEAVVRMGFGAEVAAVVQHQAFDWLDAPIERVGVEVHADPVRARDGELRRPARRRRARGDPQDGASAMADRGHRCRGSARAWSPGTIVRWLKSEGDQVEKGEPLYELDTDKVTQEVEADVGGVLLKILVDEGEVPVGDDRRVRGRGGRGRARGRGGSGAGVPSRDRPRAAAARPETRPRRSARRAGRAEARGGSARDGGADQGVAARAPDRARAWHRPRRADAAPAPRGGSSPRTSSAPTSPAPRDGAARGAAAAGEVERVELTSLRKTIARRMTEAWAAPAFQIVDVRGHDARPGARARGWSSGTRTSDRP